MSFKHQHVTFSAECPQTPPPPPQPPAQGESRASYSERPRTPLAAIANSRCLVMSYLPACLPGGTVSPQGAGTGLSHQHHLPVLCPEQLVNERLPTQNLPSASSLQLQAKLSNHICRPKAAHHSGPTRSKAHLLQEVLDLEGCFPASSQRLGSPCNSMPPPEYRFQQIFPPASLSSVNWFSR